VASKVDGRLATIDAAMVDLYQTHTCADGRTLEFVWDGNKDETNQEDHRAVFAEAIEAFCDPKRIIYADKKHSRRDEKRLFLLGKVKSGLVLTVRFTRRDKYIRIIGAGFWREGQVRYDNSKKP
jgi:uncharacterized DUF497 family protein